MSEHLDFSRVTGLLAPHDAGSGTGSGEGDAELQRALAHAALCDECRAELDHARRTLALLDLLPADEPPSRKVLDRVRAAVHAEMDRAERAAAPSRPTPARITRWLPAAATLMAWGLTILAARERHLEALSLSVLGAALATVGAMLALGGRLVVLASLLAISFALAYATSAAGEAFVSVGFKCVVVELVAGALPLGSMVWLAMSRRVSASAGSFAIAAVAGALAGQAGLQLTCPDNNLAHLWLVHAGAVVLAALLGAAATLLPRPRPLA